MCSPCDPSCKTCDGNCRFDCLSCIGWTSPYTQGLWLKHTHCSADCGNCGLYAYDGDNTCVATCPNGYQMNTNDYWYC